MYKEIHSVSYRIHLKRYTEVFDTIKSKQRELIPIQLFSRYTAKWGYYPYYRLDYDKPIVVNVYDNSVFYQRLFPSSVSVDQVFLSLGDLEYYISLMDKY